MKFSEFKAQNFANYSFFEADEQTYKGFMKLAFKEYTQTYQNTNYILEIDEKSLNSYPNFTQKHQIVISDKNYNDAFFSFKVSCENTSNTLGFRLFTRLDEKVRDFVTNDISLSDEIAMFLKLNTLKNFKEISKCGWWITDIWRDMYKIEDSTQSESFIDKILSSKYSKMMHEINQTLLDAQNSAELASIIQNIKTMQH